MKSSVVAAVLAACSSFALAADQAVSFSGLAASFDSAGVVLDGGDDIVTFGGLESGLYNFSLTLSGQYLDLSAAVLNGVAGTIIESGRWTFVGIEGDAQADFALTLTGLTTSARAIYSGELTVTPVPEPSTSSLMFAGLAAMGFVAAKRRRPA
jgi:hypothetical protein